MSFESPFEPRAVFLQPSAATGYAEPAAYLRKNTKRNEFDAHHTFSLRFALNHWAQSLSPGWLAVRLGPHPRCLIQGSASTDNVDALAQFLGTQGIPAPEIHVIDLIDLPALGYAEHGAIYHQADAGDLSALFETGSVHLILQDHMLNCAPIAQYRPILSELARILSPSGAALLHYTDPSLFPPAEGNDLARFLLPDSSGYHLQMPGSIEFTLASRTAAQRLMEVEDGITLATLPLGNLEHFIPFEHFSARLSHAGLTLHQRQTVTVLDGEGLYCRRNHCLVTA